MMDPEFRPADGDTGLADDTATTCVAALDSLIRLSQMSAATHGAVTQLRELAGLCNEAGRVINGIRDDLACEDVDTDPERLVDALERLNCMAAAVRAATDSADETILRFSAARP
jgi:DNA repair ATPase RecN